MKILVAGPVRGKHESLFATVRKYEAKAGPFGCLLCVGDFFGPDGAHELQDFIDGKQEVPVDTYFCGSSTLKSIPRITALGRSGVESVGGLRVAYLAGVHDSANFDVEDHEGAGYSREDLENVLISSGAYKAGGGVDILLTTECGAGFDVHLEPGTTKIPLGVSEPLGEACANIATQYHFAAGRETGFSLDPYRVGRGAARIARLHVLPPIGCAKSLRAFQVEPFVAEHIDIDTEDGAKAAALAAAALRAATQNPYVVAATRKRAGHKPPPGLVARAAGTVEPPVAVPEEEKLAAVAEEEEQDDDAAALDDSLQAFPSSFGGRGTFKGAAPMRLPERPSMPIKGPAPRPAPVQFTAPVKKEEKRRSIYADQNGGLANPKKGKRKRMGAPSGPQF